MPCLNPHHPRHIWPKSGAVMIFACEDMCQDPMCRYALGGCDNLLDHVRKEHKKWVVPPSVYMYSQHYRIYGPFKTDPHPLCKLWLSRKELPKGHHEREGYELKKCCICMSNRCSMAVGLDGLIQCLSCAQFFHVQCHLPIPQAGSGFLVKGRWYCAMCVRDGRDKKYQQPVRAADAQSKDQNYQTRDYSNDFDIDPAVLAERFEPKTRPYRIPRDSNGNPRLNSVDDPYSFDPVIDEKGKGSIRQPLTGFNGEPSDRLFSSLQTRREKKSKDQAFINFIRSKRSPEDQDTPTKSIEGAPSSFGLNRHTDLCNTKETGNEEGDIQRAIKPSLQNLGSSEANIKDEKELCTWVDRAVMNVYGKTPENMDLDNDDLDIRDFDDDNLDDTPEYMLMSDYDDLDDIDEEMMRSDDDLAIQEAIQRSLAKSDNSEPSFYSSTGKTEDIKRIGASPTKESKDKKKTRIHIKVPTAEKRKRSPTD